MDTNEADPLRVAELLRRERGLKRRAARLARQKAALAELERKLLEDWTPGFATFEH